MRIFASIADQELNDRWRVSKFRSIPEATLDQYSTRAMSKSESIGLDFRAEKELPDSQMGFGLRWNWQYWDMLSETMNVSARLIPLIDQTNLSTYIEGDKYFGNFEFSGAVRFDQFETEPKDSLALLRNYRPTTPLMIRENGLSSRVSLKYLLTDLTHVFVEIGHSVRLPDPHELYLQYEQPGTGQCPCVGWKSGSEICQKHFSGHWLFIPHAFRPSRPEGILFVHKRPDLPRDP